MFPFASSDFTSIISHIHNWVLFLLWCCVFILSGIISPLISNIILGTYLPGNSAFNVLSFCLFIRFIRFSRQAYWSGLLFPSPVDHILSELSTKTHLFWVALQGMAHSFIELDRLWSMSSDWLISCDCGFHYVCPLIDKDKRLLVGGTGCGGIWLFLWWVGPCSVNL